MIKIIKYPIIIFLAIILGGSFHLFTGQVLGWTNPSGAPPDGDTAKPVNVGSTSQSKTGNLTLSGSSLTLGAGNNFQVNGPTAVTGSATISGYFWTSGPANFCKKVTGCAGAACQTTGEANYYVAAIGGCLCPDSSSYNCLCNPSSPPGSGGYQILCKNAD